VNCTACHHPDTRVLETRSSGDGTRRRRQCLACGQRFTTFERVEQRAVLVVKKDGTREPFDRDKLVTGLRLACRKRPVSAAQLDAAADRVEQEILASAVAEVAAGEIGRLVLEELKALDLVAYLRFASVYREVSSPAELLALLQPLLTSPPAEGSP
jgi:transcriptional repressor NrdR